MAWFVSDSGLLVRETDLHDLVYMITPTRTGGSGYYEDDFQKLFPNQDTRGLVVAQARENLLANLTAGKQNTSFEVDETKGDWAYGAASSLWARHGLQSLLCSSMTATNVLDITSVTLAGSQYTALAYLKAVTEDVTLALWDNVDGYTNGNAISEGEEGLSTATKTFNGGSTSRALRLMRGGDGATYYVDNVMLVSGSTPLPFVEDEATAVLAYFVNSDLGLEAGPFSIVIIINPTWDYDDGIAHYIFGNQDGGGSTNAVEIIKATDNKYKAIVYDHTSGYYKLEGTKATSAREPVILVFSYDNLGQAGSGKFTVNGTSLITETISGTPTMNAWRSNSYLGSKYNGTVPLNGTMLLYLFKDYVFSTDEHTRLSQLGAAFGRYKKVA